MFADTLVTSRRNLSVTNRDHGQPLWSAPDPQQPLCRGCQVGPAACQQDQTAISQRACQLGPSWPMQHRVSGNTHLSNRSQLKMMGDVNRQHSCCNRTADCCLDTGQESTQDQKHCQWLQTPPAQQSLSQMLCSLIARSAASGHLGILSTASLHCCRPTQPVCCLPPTS